jgi:hypothetical protein
MNSIPLATLVFHTDQLTLICNISVIKVLFTKQPWTHNLNNQHNIVPC